MIVGVELPPGPGKTAPRLLEDLRDYDPRRPIASNTPNLLGDPAPIYRKSYSDLYPLRQRSNDCSHTLWRKDASSVIPAIDEQPTTASKFISSSFCSKCCQHFDVVADYTRRPEKISPCPHNDANVLHHLQQVSVTRKTALERKSNPNKYDNHYVSHTFECTATSCPLVLDIRISRPRLQESYLSLLCDKTKVSTRAQRAVRENPERYQGYNISAAEPGEALLTLRRYLTDAMAGGGKKIAVENKKFQTLFGTDCDELLAYLGFTAYSQRNELADVEEKYWRLPEIEPIDLELDHFGAKTQRDFLNDVVFELAHRLNTTPPQNPQSALIFKPLPARKDLAMVLDCLDYPRLQRPIDLEGDTHPHYLGLGANRDFSDQLLIFAYERQKSRDPRNAPYYLECLLGIRQGRDSTDLDTVYSIAVSQGELTLTEIEDSYRFLDIPPDTTDGDEWIIGMYKSRIESAPRQKEEAKKALMNIGVARDSALIQAAANNTDMTYAEALGFLNLDAESPSDWVVAMGASKVDECGDKIKVAKAMETIGKERNDASLQLEAQNMLSGDSNQALSLRDAYSRLQALDTLPDDTVIEYFKANYGDAKDAAGSKASYVEALRVIANARNSFILKDLADNPGGPVKTQEGSEDVPAGLENIGNTCYLNSLLQFYYTVKAVREIVMNFDQYRLDLRREIIDQRVVGNRSIEPREAEKAQQFVLELQNLFTDLRQAPKAAVRPTENLAVLTLFSAATEENFRRQSISSPRPAFIGPVLPPVPERPAPNTPPASAAVPRRTANFEPEATIPEDAEMDDERAMNHPDHNDGSGSDITLVDVPMVDLPNASEKDQILEAGSSEAEELGEPTVETHVHEPEYLIVSTDKIQVLEHEPTEFSSPHIRGIDGLTSDHTMTNGSTVESPIELDGPAAKPPPVPPRNKPTPLKISSVSENADKLAYGAQQDVTEVIGNVIFRLGCAIKPSAILEDGEQVELIRQTFYGSNAVSLKKGLNYDIKVEPWLNLIVFPPQEGSRDIYEALDAVFDEIVVEIDINGAPAKTKQFTSIHKLPPIFQVQFQRTAFDSKTQTASKNRNPIHFDETIYLDRYMNNDRVLARRRDAWKWKSRLRWLEGRQNILLKSNPDFTVPEALEETSKYLRSIQEMDIDGIHINPALIDGLSERVVEINSEIEEIGAEIASLKSKLKDQFMDMHQERYRLQAVFMHSGSNSFGHYWIFIYDFERDIWREYNDSRVSEVHDRKRIFESVGPSGGTPYYLVYVRDELKNDLVDAVYRHIVKNPEPIPELEDAQMDGVWEDDSTNDREMAEQAQHIEYQNGEFPSINSTMNQGSESWDDHSEQNGHDLNGMNW